MAAQFIDGDRVQMLPLYYTGVMEFTCRMETVSGVIEQRGSVQFEDSFFAYSIALTFGGLVTWAMPMSTIGGLIMLGIGLIHYERPENSIVLRQYEYRKVSAAILGFSVGLLIASAFLVAVMALFLVSVTIFTVVSIPLAIALSIVITLVVQVLSILTPESHRGLNQIAVLTYT